MTVKQRMFVKSYIKNKGNGTQAAMEAYDAKNYNTAHAISVENLQKPTLRREIEIALEAKGLSDSYIAEMLREATVSGVGQKATNSDALRGLEMMLKLKDAFPQKVNKSAHFSLSMRQEIEKKSIIELKRDLELLNKQTRDLLEDITN